MNELFKTLIETIFHPVKTIKGLFRIEDNSKLKDEIRKLKIFLILIPACFICNNLAYSDDSTPEVESYRVKYEELKIAYNTLQKKHNQAIALLEQIADSTPEYKNYNNGRIFFAIADKIEYSIGFVEPYKLGWQNLKLNIGYITPDFIDVQPINFINSTGYLGLSYNLYGFNVAMVYDFRNNFMFHVEFDLLTFFKLDYYKGNQDVKTENK